MMDESREKVIAYLQSRGAMITSDMNGDPITLHWGRHAPITDDGLEQLGKLPSLREVELLGMTDIRIKYLAPLVRLSHLSFGYGLFGSDLSDQGLTELGPLTGLVTLILHCPRVTDAGIGAIARLTQLKSLDLSYTRVTRVGLQTLTPLVELTYIEIPPRINLEYVKLFPRLEMVYDFGTKDSDLTHLKFLPYLTTLGIDSPEVTDAGVDDLVELTTLRQLYLINTKVTETAMARLRAALPNCDIVS